MCLKHLDLCSGIGGFALGLQSTGYFKTIGFCEIDSFCQKVLKKNFPGVPNYNDIKEFKPNDEGIKADIVTSGFPCPAFSFSGKRGGFSQDDLFFENIRIIKETKPSFIIFEKWMTALAIIGLIFIMLYNVFHHLFSHLFNFTH